jgi:hypothetical protein
MTYTISRNYIFPITVVDPRTGKLVRLVVGCWALCLEDPALISAVPTTIITPTLVPLIEHALSIIMRLAFIIGLITFTLTLMALWMYKFILSVVRRALGLLVGVLDFLLSFLFESKTQSSSFVTHSRGRVLLGHQVRQFSSSALVNLSQGSAFSYWLPGDTLPEAKTFYVMLPSIHASNFLPELRDVLNSILVDPISKVNLLVECVMEGNRYRSLAPSLHVASGFSLSELENHFNVRIENFEVQSGSGEDGSSVIGIRAMITNISSAPNPSAIPFTSDPENVEWKRNVKQDQKAIRRPSASVRALKALSEQITSSQSSMDSKFSTLNSTMNSGFESVVQAIKTQPTSSSLAFNWTPLIQGIATGIATSFGAQIKFPTQSSSISTTEPTSVSTTPSSVTPQVDLTPILSRLDKLEVSVSTLAQGQNSLTQTINALAQIKTEQTLQAFIQAMTPTSNDSNGSSTSSTPPTSLSEEKVLQLIQANISSPPFKEKETSSEEAILKKVRSMVRSEISDTISSLESRINKLETNPLGGKLTPLGGNQDNLTSSIKELKTTTQKTLQELTNAIAQSNSKANAKIEELTYKFNSSNNSGNTEGTPVTPASSTNDSNGTSSKISPSKSTSSSRYHNLWPFKFLEKLEVDHKSYLYSKLEPWQLLEFETYKELVRLRRIVRYSQSHEILQDPLKSSDFLIYDAQRRLVRVLECKYLSFGLPITDKKAYLQSVFKHESVTYVVNDTAYETIKNWNLLNGNVVKVSMIGSLF